MVLARLEFPFPLASQPKLQVAKATLHVTATHPPGRPPPGPESRLHSSVVVLAVSFDCTRPVSACGPNLSDVMVSKQP